MSFEAHCKALREQQTFTASQNLDFDNSINGSALQGCEDAGDLPYKTEEDWQYSCEAESGSPEDCLGLFQPVSGYANFPGIYGTAHPGDEQSKSLPDSPFSLQSSTSHQRVPIDTSFTTRASALTNFMLPANDALGPHMLAGNSQPGDTLFLDSGEASSERERQLVKATSLADLCAMKAEGDQQPNHNRVWGFGAPEHRLEGSPLSTLSTMGSSMPQSFLALAAEHSGLPTLMLPEVDTSNPGLGSTPHTPLQSNPSLPLDSPLSHSLTETIFEDIDHISQMHDFEQGGPLAPPSQSDSGNDFSLPYHLTPQDLLPSGSIAEGGVLSEGPPAADALAQAEPSCPAEQAASLGRSRRLRLPTFKRACKPYPDDDADDYVPHLPKKHRAGLKHKKAAKPMPADDALDYHPNERRTTAVTARGRRVNRLQLCEEDHSEDNAETGNRRSKHHNPWTVEETEALVSGVESCGGGKWADIKKLGLRAIEKRSAVDLKDKWRNLQAALYRTKCDKKREIPASLLQRIKLLVPLTATKARGEARPSAGRGQARHKDRAGRQK